MRVLAIFVGDEAVGIYSFAAMFIEGLYQVPTVIRTVSISCWSVSLPVTGTKRFGRIMIGGVRYFRHRRQFGISDFSSLGPFFPMTLSHAPIPMSILTGGSPYAAFGTAVSCSCRPASGWQVRG